MIMKLSEMSFRPLFFKVGIWTHFYLNRFFCLCFDTKKNPTPVLPFFQLFDWAKTEGASKDRQLTFYRLADCIAGELKGLFSLFAGHLVKPFADSLNQINTSKTGKNSNLKVNARKKKYFNQMCYNALITG